jgi:hypothetical protein
VLEGPTLVLCSLPSDQIALALHPRGEVRSILAKKISGFLDRAQERCVPTFCGRPFLLKLYSEAAKSQVDGRVPSAYGR